MSNTKRKTKGQVGCGKKRKTKMKRGGCMTCSKLKYGGKKCNCSKCSSRQSGGSSNYVGIGSNLTSWVPHYFTHTLPNVFMGVPTQQTFW